MLTIYKLFCHKMFTVYSIYVHYSTYTERASCIVRTFKDDLALRLLKLNLLFYHFNQSEPTYKSQCTELM